MEPVDEKDNIIAALRAENERLIKDAATLTKGIERLAGEAVQHDKDMALAQAPPQDGANMEANEGNDNISRPGDLVERLRPWINANGCTDVPIEEAIDTIATLRAERDNWKNLYEKGCEQWNPVYETVLNERDRLRAALERIAICYGSWDEIPVDMAMRDYARSALAGEVDWGPDVGKEILPPITGEVITQERDNYATKNAITQESITGEGE